MQAVCTHFSHKLHITAGSFLAAQFGIWIGMVGHSAEFYFSVSDFVSFSQFHFSYFAYVSKNVSLKLLIVNLVILDCFLFFVPPT